MDLSPVGLDLGQCVLDAVDAVRRQNGHGERVLGVPCPDETAAVLWHVDEGAVQALSLVEEMDRVFGTCHD